MAHYKLTAFRLLVWLAPLLQGAQVPDVGCKKEAAPVLVMIRERWRWEMFWGTGITSPPYDADKRVHIGLFWSATQSGFCSLELGSCALYDMLGSSLGQMAASSPTSGQHDLNAAIQGLLGAPTRPPIVTRGPGASKEPNATPPSFSSQGHKFSIPPRDGGKTKAGADQHQAEFHLCTVEESLPQIAPPEAIRMKVVPDDLPAVKSLLARLAQNIPAVTRASTEFVVPFYAKTDPMLYVLITTKGRTESVVFLVHDGLTGAWRTGGHFDKQTGQFQLDKIVPLILSAEMTRVKPG